jgi:outer membrane murein-binding lipoprotein Lpp
MGFKLSAILGGLLLVSIAGSAWYIDRLLDEISTLKGNQLILETEIQEQNRSIEIYKENAAKSQQEITLLTKKNQESMKEVNKLRDTFARHDLDELALAKPGMIQTRVNNGTKRVKEDLINLTKPEQYE